MRRVKGISVRLILAATFSLGLSVPIFVNAAELSRTEAIAEMRKLSEKMAEGHFSTAAKQRAKQFLRLTEMREWRDASGKHNTTARYVGHEKAGADVQVSLRKTTGEVVRVPLSQLSVADQKVVRDLARVLERLSEDAVAYRDYLADRVRRGELQSGTSRSAYRAVTPSAGLGVNPAAANGLWVNPYGSFTGWEAINGPYYSSSWNVGLNPYGSFNYYGQPAYVTPYMIYNNPRPYYTRRYYPDIYYGNPRHHHHHGHGYHRPGNGNGGPILPDNEIRRGPRSTYTGGNVYGY